MLFSYYTRHYTARTVFGLGQMYVIEFNGFIF